MPASEIIGKLLSNMGPGLASGIGAALTPDAPDPTKSTTAKPNSFKNGGKVEKTGLALVHAGETVIPAKPKENDMKKETVHLSKHRVVMHLNKGGLHRWAGVPEGETIPKSKVEEAANSDNPHVAKMGHLAQTMASWHHGK